MNLYYLRYFVKLAHVQHYTKAAEQLCIAQPSLSHAISQMEKELGLPLFEKNGRKTTLTRFGEEFLQCAELTLSTLDTGIESIQRNARGDGLIRIGMLRPLGIEFIPRLASKFLKENPNSEIQFTFHTGDTKTLLEGLKNKAFDLIFCSQPSSKYNFKTVCVQKQDLVLIVPKKHPLSSYNKIDLADTAPYPHIFFNENTGIRPIVEQAFKKINMTPHVAYETEEDQVIAGLVAEGFGIAIVPYMDLLLKLELNILQINTPACERDLFMINDESIFMPPVVRKFHQFVQEEMDKQQKENIQKYNH